MDRNTQLAIARAFERYPRGMRYRKATEDDLRSFEAQFGAIPKILRWFLVECGGGVVGSEWVDGIDELVETHNRFSEERAEGFWDLLDQVFVIGRDGGGNYFGIQRATGSIVVQDHDFGGIHTMAQSFDAFLAAGFSDLPELQNV